MTTFDGPASPLATIRIETRNRAQVRSWLYVVCGLIFVMVLVGGATRLTDSGLSITEWQPVMGAIPPLTASDWATAFAKYQQTPEYQLINRGMTLSAFKTIFWWEWTHRFLGRLIGIAVAAPLAYFWISGRLEDHLKPRLLLLFALGGMQGATGWWMVASGLVERTDVSQYRLAIHLTLACIILAYALWLARALAPHRAASASRKLRLLAPAISMLLLAQIFLGGLVAGLDAGLAFNDWPLMDGAVIPHDMGILQPAWRNIFENPKMAQFLHRNGGYLVLVAVALQFWLTRKWDPERAHSRRAALLVGLILVQAAIGVVTLVHAVPIAWALLHQAGALAALGFAVAHWRGLVGEHPPVTTLVRRH
jgi:heme a synthase